MAYTTIDDPSAHFNTVLWTGDASSDKSISGVGFQPDLVWAKNRSDSNDNQIIDSSRGAGKILRPDNTGAELTRSSDVGAGGLQNFESDGFDVHSTTSNTNLNDSGELNVAWCWKANGGTTTTNDASSTGVGSEDTVYQANTTAGFSIVTWTGPSGSGVDTRAHGLGAVPHVILVKARTGTENWVMYHHKNTSAPETDVLKLNSANGTADESGNWNDTAPTSTVFTSGDTGATNEDSKTYVAYIWKEIQGYSKFGSYTGNGNADGAFVYTGFKPAWVMIKRTDSTNNWGIFDSTRDTFNQVGKQLYANGTEAEDADSAHSSGRDYLSNGFKLRETGNAINGSGATYIYMAFAEHPFVSSKGVPCTAK